MRNRSRRLNKPFQARGRCSAIGGFLALVTGPLVAAVWLFRQKLPMLLLGLLLLALLLGADLLLRRGTLEEEGYFLKVWRMGPLLVILWALAWLYGQGLLLAAIVTGLFH